jgi:glycosyltransferase involved in cell wall biosynthesis
MNNKTLIITGTRGIPAKHGGFETFAEYLALYLVKKDWDVIVYCQGEPGTEYNEKIWQGVQLIMIPENRTGPLGTIIFDFKTTIHSLKHKGLVLTLGYNTALFNIIYRLFGRINLINMDGIEWKREKWSGIAKSWFWLNERFGCWFGHHLISDHPEIKKHLATRVNEKKITTIAYGGKQILDADPSVLEQYGLIKNNYAIVIARAEPENSILEIVEGFSSEKRDHKLVILGNYDIENNDYHKRVKAASSEDVLFLGALYDNHIVGSLRYLSCSYIHGHQVGGTNPSLVEAMGAKNAVIAHDNKFNRWVASDGALYFTSSESIAQCFTQLFSNIDLQIQLQTNIDKRFQSDFTWEKILGEYESLLNEWHRN